MTLQKQSVSIPVLGLNSIADPKASQAGEFDLIENMTFNRTARGGAELRKRFGGAALTRVRIGGGGGVISASRLATFGSERLMVASPGTASEMDSVFSYSPTRDLWKCAAVTTQQGQGAMLNLGLTCDVIGASPTNYAAPDVAVNAAGTLMCMVWRAIDGSTASFVSVIDLVTNEQIQASVNMGNLSGPLGWVRVVALSSVFMIIFGATTGNLLAKSIAYATPETISGFTVIAADLNATCKADVIRNGTNDSVLIAYHSTVPNTKILIWNSNMTAGGSTTNAEIPSQAIGWLNWDFSDGNGYLAFVSAATGAKMFTVAQAGPAVSATTTMDATVTAAANVTGYKTVSPGAPQLHAYIEVRAAATYNTEIRRWPGSGVSNRYQGGAGIAAACYKCPGSGRYYLPVSYDSALQSGYYLLDVFSDNSSAPLIALRALYGLGGGLSTTGTVGAMASISSTVGAWAAMKLVQNPAGTKIFSACLLRVDFAAKSLSGAKRVGELLHMPGGSTRVYDGAFCSEMGFYIFPEAPALTAGAGGSLTLLGSYQYAIVYAWPDSRGQWHRSAPSPIASVTLTGANNRVTLTISTMRMSNRDNNTIGATPPTKVYIEVYRTVAGGTTFYRAAGGGTLLNTQALDTVSYVDNDSDATIQQNEILYTVGKVLPHIGPPSARLMESWRNRLFLAGTENPNELWVSNEYSFGLGGVSFSDALVVQMETDGGPITALCEMDDRLVIFKRNSIYVLSGNGPTLTGDNPYQQPTKLSSVIGAVEQRGVVKTRDGVMFKSTRGIYLLGHSGQIIYAGAGVDVYNSLTLTGSCVVEDEEQVRFVTSEGRTLVYHYGFPDDSGIGRWTTFTNQPAVDCIVWNGKFVYLKSDATVVEETANAYTDPGSVSINSKVRLAWLSLTQFFGRFRLYGVSLLGDLLATFTLTHRLAYDYDATVIESETKAVTVATLPPLQLNPARRRATAIQPTLEETSTTQGFTVSGWGLEVGVEPTAAKPGTGQFLT